MLYRGGVIRKIEELAEIRMCKRIMKHQTKTTGDVPFYKIGTFGGLADAYISRETFNLYKTKYPYPRKGQVLLSAAGTIGRSVIFDGKDSYYQDSNIVWLDTDESVIDNRYLHYCFKYLVEWNMHKTDGSVISRLYNDDIRNIAIPLPTLNIQREFATQIEEFESKIKDLEAELDNNESFKIRIVENYLT